MLLLHFLQQESVQVSCRNFLNEHPNILLKVLYDYFSGCSEGVYTVYSVHTVLIVYNEYTVHSVYTVYSMYSVYTVYSQCTLCVLTSELNVQCNPICHTKCGAIIISSSHLKEVCQTWHNTLASLNVCKTG